MENDVVLQKDVNEVYMNKIELKSCLEGRTDEVNFHMYVKGGP